MSPNTGFVLQTVYIIYIAAARGEAFIFVAKEYKNEVKLVEFITQQSCVLEGTKVGDFVLLDVMLLS